MDFSKLLMDSQRHGILTKFAKKEICIDIISNKSLFPFNKFSIASPNIITWNLKVPLFR